MRTQAVPGLDAGPVRSLRARRCSGQSPRAPGSFCDLDARSVPQALSAHVEEEAAVSRRVSHRLVRNQQDFARRPRGRPLAPDGDSSELQAQEQVQSHPTRARLPPEQPVGRDLGGERGGREQAVRLAEHVAPVEFGRLDSLERRSGA